MKLNPKTYAKELLDKLLVLEAEAVSIHYDMGAILEAMYSGQLYQHIGYASLSALVEEEMHCTPSQAHAYRRLYLDLKRLNYRRPAALKLIAAHGMTHLAKTLPNIKAQVSERALTKVIQNNKKENFSFEVDQTTAKRVRAALVICGARRMRNGRYEDITDAFLVMVNNVLNAKKAA
jgi:hypothetical protein